MDFRNQPNLPRGLRNNNPGNIKTGEGWKGVVGNDGVFDIFADDTWGLRALAMDLTAKINRDGLTTIRQIVSVYAPPSENDTLSYIQAVSDTTGLPADQQLTADAATLHSLIRGVITHENGQPANMISDADIDQGISMMGNGVGTLVKSAVDAASNDPSIAIVIGVGILGLLLYAFTRKN